MPYGGGYSGGYGGSFDSAADATTGAVNGFKVEIDWNRNGNYTDLNENVTRRVLRQSAVSLSYGRDQSTALAPTVAGRGSFTLDNRDRRFSPRNSASPLYGFVKPARPVRITRTLTAGTTYGSGAYGSGTYGGTEYCLFAGHTDDSPINPDVNSKTVTLSLVDSLADFRGLTISTPLYAGKFTGEVIGYILDACGWDGPRDLDRGGSVLPWWWEDGTDALDALEKVLRCEGPPAMLTIGSDGGIVFKDRHHRLVDAASITSQATFRDKAGVGPTMDRSFVYDDAWRNIINTGTISVDVRTKSALAAVWELDSPIGFTANQTQTFIASTSDPFTDAVTPVSGTDYTVTAGSITSRSISRTSGASTTITMTAGAGGAQIDRLQLRANPVQVAYQTQVTASDATSISDYGPRSFPNDLPFCNVYDAKAILETAIQMRAQPLPIVSARFVVAKSVWWTPQILARNLSDRVTVVETETVLNDPFFIESFDHEFTGEEDHAVTIGMEGMPPDGAATTSNVFILGGGTGHQVGDGVLAP